MGSRFSKVTAVTTAATLALAAIGGALPTVAADPSSEPLSGKLVVWDWWWQLDNTEWMRQVDAEFIEMHPGIEIEHVGQPVDQWDTLFRAANAARSGPDVAMNYAGAQGVLTYGAQGALANLKDLLSPEEIAEYTLLDAGARDYNLDNELWGISMSVNAATWYLNRELWTAAGLDPDAAPDTLEGIKSACEALLATDTIPISTGNKDAYWAYFLMPSIWTKIFEKGDAAKLATGEIKFTDPRMKELFQFIIDLGDMGCYGPDWKGLPLFMDAIDLFPAGAAASTVALMGSGPGGTERFTEALGADGFEWWRGSEGDYVHAIPGIMWTIPSYSQNPEAAAAYLRHLTTRGQVLQGGATTWTGAPVDDLDRVAAIHMDAINENSELAVTAMLTPDVLTDISAQITQASNGDITLDAALEAIQATFDRVQGGP